MAGLRRTLNCRHDGSDPWAHAVPRSRYLGRWKITWWNLEWVACVGARVLEAGEGDWSGKQRESRRDMSRGCECWQMSRLSDLCLSQPERCPGRWGKTSGCFGPLRRDRRCLLSARVVRLPPQDMDSNATTTRRSRNAEVVEIAHHDRHLGTFGGLGHEAKVAQEHVGASGLLTHGRARRGNVALRRRDLHC